MLLVSLQFVILLRKGLKILIGSLKYTQVSLPFINKAFKIESYILYIYTAPMFYTSSTLPALYGTNNLKSSINPKEAKYCLKLKKKRFIMKTPIHMLQYLAMWRSKLNK